MIAGVVQRLMQRLRAQAEAKVHALPLRHIDQQARGDLLSRVTNDLDNLAQSLQQTMSQMLTSVLLLIGVAVMMFTISPLLARRRAHHRAGVRVRHAQGVAGRARPRFLAQWGSTGVAQRPDRGGLHRPRDREGVRAPARGGGALPRHQRRRSTRRRFGAQFMSSLMQPLTMFLGNVQYVLVAVVGGLRVASAAAISVGEVQAFIQYSRTFSMPLTQLASMMNVFQSRHRLARAGARPARHRGADRPTRSTSEPMPADPGPGGLRGRVVLLRPGPAAHRAPVARRRARADHRHRRAHRRRQDHAREPHHAVLRARRRPHHPRRPRHLADPAPRAASSTSAWCCRTRGSSAARSATTSPTAAPTPPRRRSSTPPGPPTSTASCTTSPIGYDTVIDEEGDNISAGQKQLLTIARAFLAAAGDPHPRRGHQLRRHPHGGADPGGDERAARRPHQLRHRPPPLHHPGRRRDPRDGGRPHRRAGHRTTSSSSATAPYFRLYSSQFAAAVIDED